MDEYTREDMWNDARIDAQYNRYEVEVTVKFKYRVSARNKDDAECEAYDDIKDALRGSHLDYEFDKINTEEVDDERI